QLSERHSDAFAQYFNLQYDPPGFSDLRFQIVVQALALYYDELRASDTDLTALEGLLPLGAEASRTGLPDATRRLLDSHPLVMAERALAALTERHKDLFGPLIQDESGTGRERFVRSVIEILRYVLT